MNARKLALFGVMVVSMSDPAGLEQLFGGDSPGGGQFEDPKDMARPGLRRRPEDQLVRAVGFRLPVHDDSATVHDH